MPEGPAASGPYERLEAPVEPEALLGALRREIRGRGMVEYAVVDHGRDMAAAGAPGHRAWTVIFGAPAAGARLLDLDPLAAVDIPLHLAIVADGEGRCAIILRPMHTLLGSGELATVADAMTQTLRSIALAACENARGI